MQTRRQSEVVAAAWSLGFDLVGFTSAEPLLEAEAALRERQERLRCLPWLTAERMRLATHPGDLLPGARSVMVVAARYGQKPLAPVGADALGTPQGLVARYAWGPDYHQVLWERLSRLIAILRQRYGDLEARAFVDSGPLAERALAMRAGLGQQGHNCTLITPEQGSWVVLGEVVTNLELGEPSGSAGVPRPPHPLPGRDAPRRVTSGTVASEGGRPAPALPEVLLACCPSCGRCQRACPTGALEAAYSLDVSRCLAYLTIEHRGSIPRALRPALGNRVFGCDACQEACPANQSLPSPSATLFPPDPSLVPTSALLPLLRLSEGDFQSRFRHSPLKRARRGGLRRNAAVALGNQGDQRALPALSEALQDPDSLLREHAAWALGRLGTSTARQALEAAYRQETEPAVREELELALG